MAKMVWSLEETDNMIVVTRQVEVDKDEEGNSIFNTRRICRENYPLAFNEMRASMDAIQKQLEKDSKTSKE